MLPPKESGLLCVHFNSIDESLRANLIALKYKPSASELIDHYILECTKDNIEQRRTAFLARRIPGAILVIEFTRDSREEIKSIAQQVERNVCCRVGLSFSIVWWIDTKNMDTS